MAIPPRRPRGDGAGTMRVRRSVLFRLAVIATVLSGHGALEIVRGESVRLEPGVRQRCLRILRDGLRGDDFWPAIHAAEGLTGGGHGQEVRTYLGPLLAETRDDQRRCGIARELVRAGDRWQADVMLEILAGEDPHGHVHAAESLYKVVEIGDGSALRSAFAPGRDARLRLMAAGALGRCGHPGAMSYLRDMLNDKDPQLFMIAAWILGRIGDASDVPRLSAQLPRCPDALTRAYLHHALAALGDAGGQQELLKNLRSDDPAIRTYAATFAGDARMSGAAESLIAMLDDAHGDARIRAAQSLLVLAGAAAPDRGEDISQLVFAATRENPRYTEGSVVRLRDGSLLFAVTEFHGSGSDFAKARIVARRSRDGGRTWGPQRVLQENTGGLNVMSVTLRRIRRPDGGRVLAMFYLEKNGFDDLDLKVRFSTDEAARFGPPVLVTSDAGYHVVNNDRVTQLSTGRLLAPAASTADVHKVNHFVSHCYISDDGGRTWRNGKGRVDAPKRGAMEPEVVELADGRVLMIVRTQLGIIGRSYSRDGGETWSKMEPLGLKAPEAPATLRRIPATGDLLLIWNHTYTPGAGHGGRRTPLTAAVSSDEGRHWQIAGNLEGDPRHTYSYPSLLFVGERAVMSYWESGEGGRLSCRFRSVPVSWFYRPR